MSQQKIITLGPQGTFSNLAASMVSANGSDIVYTQTIPQITDRVIEEKNALGVIPIENSVGGIVGPAQDSLVELDVVILHELTIPVTYSLLANVPAKEVKHFYAHPQAFNQTMKFSAHHMPDAAVLFSESNIHSTELFLENRSKPVAAIIPLPFAQKHAEFHPYILAENIQDYAHNQTRFFVIQKRSETHQFNFEQPKTSIFVAFHVDRSSLLFELLREFHVYDINLCRLESRPSKDSEWTYVFFIDFYNNHRTEKCLHALQNSDIQLKVLGSYDQISCESKESS